MRHSNTLILFTKTPQICRVKTRLSPTLSHGACLQLHKALIQHQLACVDRNQTFKLVVYATQPVCLFPGTNKSTIKQQTGLNLGERMHNAIKEELKKAQRVVLIGSDCVQFTTAYIQQAFAALQSNNDICIAPTHDGGYCLIGMRKPCQSLFKRIDWSTSEVFNQTCARMNKHSLALHMLDTLYDIDTPDDLRTLQTAGLLPEWARCFLSNKTR